MVTFETKCYENDWEFILMGNYLRTMIERCNYRFAKRVVIINNVKDIEKVSYYASRKVKRGIIDEYHIAENYAKEALDFFEIDPSSFDGGYYYSIAELVGIFLCKTKYLLHFSSDSLQENKPSAWIEKAIQLFEHRRDIIVANPTWDYRFEHAEEESFDRTDDFVIGYGFSDQCYLIETERFRKPVYNEKNEASARYPEYGGELFEKRVDSFMRNHQLLRITSKNTAYIHRNFPKEPKERWRKKWQIFFNRV